MVRPVRLVYPMGTSAKAEAPTEPTGEKGNNHFFKKGFSPVGFGAKPQEKGVDKQGKEWYSNSS